MAMTAEPGTRLRVLMELRPGMGDHAGIPQATRLLFGGFAGLDGLHVERLLQSAGHVLGPGLPPNGAGWLGNLSRDRQVNRLGRVVISIEQRPRDLYAYAMLRTIVMALKHVLSGRQRLTRFEAEHSRDLLWRRFFARTLPPEDFERVMNADFTVAQIPWTAMHICVLVTGKLGLRLYPRIDTRDFDVMICETPYPATAAPSTGLVAHYHDAIPLLMPHTISDRRWHQAFHHRALRRNVESGAWFVCVSDATRRELFAQVAARYTQEAILPKWQRFLRPSSS